MHESLQRVYDVLKLSPSGLANALNESPQNINNWAKRGLSKSGALKISQKYGYSMDWLLTGKGEPQPLQFSFKPPKDTELLELPDKTIPVISWVQAGNWTPVIATDLSEVIEHLPYDPRAGKDGFALIVKGVSMEPEFRKNDRIYVNPNYQIDELPSGSLVVMSCNSDEEATFKELIVEGGKRYLRALNPNWIEPIMQLDDSCRLVGKVVGKYVIY